MHTKYIKIQVLALLVFLFTQACSDMETIHEQYLQGETIYAGKLDSIKVFSGFERLKIIGLTRYLGVARECVVEWGEDSRQVFPIENINNGEFEMLIDGLEERGYEFTIYTLDEEDNKSIEQIVTGRSMGEIFRSSQLPRRIAGYVFSGGALSMRWADNAESEFVEKTVVKYENSDGNMTTEVVFREDSLTALDNWKKDGNIEIVSYVLTGTNGFDTLVLPPAYDKLPTETIFELDKEKISLVHMASDNPGTGYGANPDKYLFDGNESFNGDVEGYHSDENANPHHLTIDLGVVASIRKFRVGLRTDNFKGNNPTAFQLWGIVDISNAETDPADEATFLSKGWVKLGEFTGLNENSSYHEVELPEGGERVRYLRYRVTDSPSGAAQATEMTIWGENIGSVL